MTIRKLHIFAVATICFATLSIISVQRQVSILKPVRRQHDMSHIILTHRIRNTTSENSIAHDTQKVTQDAETVEIRRQKTGIIYVDSKANFTTRIRQMNDVIDRVRQEVLADDVNKSAEVDFVNKQSVRIIKISDDNYLAQLATHRHITTVVLPWLSSGPDWSSLNDYSNLLIQNYYPWSGSNICRWLKTNHKLPSTYVKTFRKLSCTNDLSQTATPRSLEFAHLKPNDVKDIDAAVYRKPPSTIVYLHVMSAESLITSQGHVRSGKLRLLLDYCFRRHDDDTLSADDVKRLPVYDEVFAMKHPPGAAVFHGMLEEIPRVAPFVEFLRRHPNIRIHVSEGSRVLNFLNVMGLDPSRAIRGQTRAKTLYMPRASSCMMPRLTEIQIMSDLCRKYIAQHLPPERRDRIVVLRRTGKRRFTAQSAVEAAVKAAADMFGLRFTVFSDNPLPSFNDTMATFHSAVMVVANHGAGLSNLIFCQPGTYVIEVVPGTFITPLCYLQTAHVLGHHWHGIPGLQGGDKTTRVSIKDLEAAVQYYLKRLMGRT